MQLQNKQNQETRAPTTRGRHTQRLAKKQDQGPGPPPLDRHQGTKEQRLAAQEQQQQQNSLLQAAIF